MDWPDLNTLTYWGAILAPIVAIGTILGWFFKPLLGWLRSRTKGKIDKKGISLSFVPNDFHCRWSEGRLNDQPTTGLHGRWHVTNTSTRYVTLLKARLAKHTAHTSVPVGTHYYLANGKEVFGEHPIAPGQMTQVIVALEFYPPIVQGLEPINADVIFIDNFTNEHRVPTKFVYLGPNRP